MLIGSLKFHSSRCFRSEQEEKDREYEEYRRRKYGDSREWGKVSAGQCSQIEKCLKIPFKPLLGLISLQLFIQLN